MNKLNSVHVDGQHPLNAQLNQQIYEEQPPPSYYSNEVLRVPPQQSLPPIFNQPIAYAQMPGQMPYSVSGYSGPGQIPYSIQSQIPYSMPGPGYNSVNSPLEQLRRHNRLTISSQGRIDQGMCLINIQDQNDRNLFSVQVHTTSRLIGATSRNAEFVHGGIYKIHDSSGEEVMTATQEISSLHLTMQGRAMGSVQNNNLCSTSFSASSLTEGSNFQIDGENSCALKWCPYCTESGFRITSGTQDCGSMTSKKMLGGNSLSITFPPNTNPNSKALLMAAGIMIYIGYFGKTLCCTNGARGQQCFCCSLVFIFSLVFTILPILVFTLIFVNRN